MAWHDRRWSVGWLAAGLSLLLLAPTASAGESVSRIGPEVITGARSAPVELTATTRLIGRLDVPVGRWVAWAHLETVGDWDALGPLPKADCTLAAYVPSDAGPHHAHRAVTTWYEGRHELSLNSAHTFAGAGGSWRIRCKGHDVDVRRIRMVAVRVGELRRQSLVDGSVTSMAGTGRPRVVHGSRDAAVPLPVDTWVTVARLDLAGGPWWINATIGLGGGVSIFTGSCRLRAGPSGPQSIELDSATTTSNSTKILTIALDAAAVVPSVGHGAPISVQCRATYAGYSASRIRVTAMQVGGLTTTYPSESTIGSGWPRVFHGTLPGPRTLGSPAFLVGMHLPAGDWVYSGKVDLEGFEDDIGTTGTFVDVETCGVTPSAHVVVGTTRGLFMPGAANLAVLSIARLKARTDVGMRCIDHSDDGTVFHPHEVRHVQLTALRAGRLTVVLLH